MKPSYFVKNAGTKKHRKALHHDAKSRSIQRVKVHVAAHNTRGTSPYGARPTNPCVKQHQHALGGMAGRSILQHTNHAW
jgi:hypothetical protein